MSKMFVKPAPGLKVRLPENPRAFLPDDGAEVPRDSYWVRRLRDGDVLAAEAPAEPVTVNRPAAKAATKKE